MSGAREPLLDAVRGLLERTYRLRSPIRDLSPYVIGDAGYRAIYGDDRVVTAAGSAHGGAKTLVRETADGIRAAIYYPDSLIARLEEHSPWRGVGEENVEAFAILVEELDHLLCIADRAAIQRACSLLELELHANVSKYLVLSRFVAGAHGKPLAEDDKIWLRWQLFHRWNWSDPEQGTRERYHEATRWAVRFLDGLERVQEREHKLVLLRRFHDVGAGEKLELIRSLAA